jgi:putative acetyltransferase
MNEPDRSAPALNAALRIRASSPDDAQALCELANLPGFRHGTLRLPYQSLAETRAFLEGVRPTDVQLVALIGDRIVGSAGLAVGTGRRRHCADLGIGIHDDHVRQGIGAAMIAALLDTADNWLDLKRIELTVFTDNAGAIALYEKMGFAREGVLRHYAYRNGAYADVLAMARLRPGA